MKERELWKIHPDRSCRRPVPSHFYSDHSGCSYDLHLQLARTAISYFFTICKRSSHKIYSPTRSPATSISSLKNSRLTPPRNSIRSLKGLLDNDFLSKLPSPYTVAITTHLLTALRRRYNLLEPPGLNGQGQREFVDSPHEVLKLYPRCLWKLM